MVFQPEQEEEEREPSHPHGRVRRRPCCRSRCWRIGSIDHRSSDSRGWTKLIIAFEKEALLLLPGRGWAPGPPQLGFDPCPASLGSEGGPQPSNAGGGVGDAPSKSTRGPKGRTAIESIRVRA